MFAIVGSTIGTFISSMNEKLNTDCELFHEKKCINSYYLYG